MFEYMKRIFFVLFALMISLNLAAKGMIVTFDIDSKILGCEKTTSVYLPEGYDENEDEFYPVLYLLHGLGGTHNTWKEYGMLTISDMHFAAGLANPMIIVMPDASGVNENHRGRNSGYANRPGWRYEDFFFEELIPAVEEMYRTKVGKEYRAVAGLSMGGHGSALFAMSRPEYFSSAYLMSARLSGVPEISPDRTEDYVEMLREYEFTRIFPEMTAEEIAEISQVRWFLDCGDDDYLLDGTLTLFAQMRSKGVPVELRVRNGAHNKYYWIESLPMALTFVSAGFEK
jgi:enterochelin esterase-like enzyme